AREVLAPAQGFKDMSEDEVRRLVHEETIVTEFEPERARAALPRLIRSRVDRRVARTFLDQVESQWPLNDRQRNLLIEFRRALPLPDRAAPAEPVRRRRGTRPLESASAVA